MADIWHVCLLSIPNQNHSVGILILIHRFRWCSIPGHSRAFPVEATTKIPVIEATVKIPVREATVKIPVVPQSRGANQRGGGGGGGGRYGGWGGGSGGHAPL